MTRPIPRSTKVGLLWGAAIALVTIVVAVILVILM